MQRSTGSPRRRPRTGFDYLDSALTPPARPVAMAHRGGAEHPDLIGLENTAVAFRHAVDLGYTYLETDVHATRDGVLVAFHDDVLDRVTDATGAVADLSSATVARARIGGTDARAGEPVPLMADLLVDLPTARFNIDVKSASAVRPLVDLLERTGAHDRVLIGSFSAARMAEFRRLTGGEVATCAVPSEVALVKALPSPAARAAVRRIAGGPAALQVPHRRGPVRVVTAGLVRRAHSAGLHVHVWTVDERAEMVELLDLGVDGLITDRTDVLRDLLVERGQWPEGRAPRGNRLGREHP